MNADQITPELLEEIVETHFDNLERFARIYPMIKTDDIAKVLWKKHRVPIWKQVDTVREKIREWWNQKPWYTDPIHHKWVGKYAVYLGSPMGTTYCVLDKARSMALIIAHQNQSQFTVKSDSKKIKEEFVRPLSANPISADMPHPFGFKIKDHPKPIKSDKEGYAE